MAAQHRRQLIPAPPPADELEIPTAPPVGAPDVKAQESLHQDHPRLCHEQPNGGNARSRP